jgi:hypothetical protein
VFINPSCCRCPLQVDSFNKAAAKNSAGGRLTALFKNKMMSRTRLGGNSSNNMSPLAASSQPGSLTGSPAAGGTPARTSGGGSLSADDLLTWSNVGAGRLVAAEAFGPCNLLGDLDV